MKQTFLIVIFALTVFFQPVTASVDKTDFPQPPELERDIHFWTRVYTEVDTQGGFIHDDRHLNIVYEVIHFPANMSERNRERQVKNVKKKYENILRTLAKGVRQGLTKEEQRVLELWPKNVTNHELRAATNHLRFQLGQSDHFKEGLIRSGAWKDYIRKTFSELDLPTELSVLPHVESSFNPKAHSSAGALGLWQFTRSTGRRFLRIDHVIDERLDPYKATWAAAQLLKNNYAVTGTWPLALTAYNHGAAGMRRAAQKLHTTDIVSILRNYNGRTFGFASRNFYVAFLAALEVDTHPQKYFGSVNLAAAENLEVIKTPAYLSISSLERALGVDRYTLRKFNPALQQAVWNGTKFVPKGYELRINPTIAKISKNDLLASIDERDLYNKQKPDIRYVVRRGNTLSQIASRFNVSIKELVTLNRLRSHMIRTGQVLLLPQKDKTIPVTLASVHTDTIQHSPATVPKSGIYKVRRGDTLTKIAQQFNLEVNELIAANGLRSKNRIYTGQPLKVAISTSSETETIASKTESKQNVVTLAKVDTEMPEPNDAMSPKDSEDEVPANPEQETETTTNADNADATDALEPTPAEDTKTIGSATPTESQSELSADPSDYQVASNGTIEVQAMETLGHYAEWLDLRASRLRRINHMKYRKPVVIGKRIKLDFSRVTPEKFEEQRLAYHRTLQEEFFEQFQITGTKEHIIKSGQSIWILAKRKYDVPVWLLRQYNPDLDFDSVRPGTKVTFPILEEKPEPDSPQPDDSTSA